VLERNISVKKFSVHESVQLQWKKTKFKPSCYFRKVKGSTVAMLVRGEAE